MPAVSRRPVRRWSRRRPGSGARCRWRPAGRSGTPPAHLPEAAARARRRDRWPPNLRRHPRRRARCRDSGAAQRSGDRTGPGHARNGRGWRRPPRTSGDLRNGKAWVHSSRAAAPSGRRLRPALRPRRNAATSTAGEFLQLSAFGAAGLAAGTSAPAARPGCRPAPAVSAQAPVPPPSSDTALPSGVTVPTAPWLIAENAKPGHAQLDLQPRAAQPRLEGFASQVSAVAGDDVALFVNTTARAVQAQVYRMGYYQGLGRTPRVEERLRARHPPAGPGDQQPSARSAARGSRRMTLNITKDWLPGCYLAQARRERRRAAVRAPDDSQRRVDGVLRVPEQRDHVAGLQPLGQLQPLLRPTTGGGAELRQPRPHRLVRPALPAELGLGSGGLRRQRAPPPPPARAAGARPHLLDRRRSARTARAAREPSLPLQPGPRRVLVPADARKGPPQANASGVNLAFSGRQRLLPPDPAGAVVHRAEPAPGLLQERRRGPVGARENPALTTVNWSQAPVNHPESTLIGSMYQSVGAKADMVVTDASSWFFDGCNLNDGHTFPRRSWASTTATCPSSPDRATPTCSRTRPVPGTVQLVRHHLLHGAGKRRRRLGQRFGKLRRPALHDGDDPSRSSSRAPSRASATSSTAPWRTSTRGSGSAPPARTAVRAATGTPSTRVRPRRPAAPPAPLRPDRAVRPLDTAVRQPQPPCNTPVSATTSGRRPRTIVPPK